MVVAKPEWFKRRNRDGFRIFGYPQQGIVYLILISLITICAILPGDLLIKITLVTLFSFLFIDCLIAYQKSLDERQIIHHAIVYRNVFLGIAITAVMIPIFLNYNPSETVFNLWGLLIFSGCLIAIVTYHQLNKGKWKLKILERMDIIARSKWFKRRNKNKYFILDISWNGIVLMSLIFLFKLFYWYNIHGNILIQIISTALFIFLVIIYLIAFTRSFDERQKINYAITYRNAFWGMVISFIMIQSILFNYNLNSEEIFYLIVAMPITIGFLTAIITYYKLQGELLWL